MLNLSIVILCHRESIIHWLWHSLCHLFFSFSENIGIKNAKLFEGDMILSTAQRLAAMKGLDVDRARGNARGSVMNMQWPGGVMIYDIATKIGEDRYEKSAMFCKHDSEIQFLKWTQILFLCFALVTRRINIFLYQRKL